MDFPQEMILPQKTMVSKGSARAVGKEAAEWGSRGLIVHGNSLVLRGNKDAILAAFPQGIYAECFCRAQAEEPTLEEVGMVINHAKNMRADWIVGIGGGSVLDLAKAGAGLFHAKETPYYYQTGGMLKEKGIPFFAVPTTAGTGAEVTPNAVIINTEKKVKLSIRDNSFLARKVILDADLLIGLPSHIMAYAAMDALVQAYESFISKNATWFTEALSLKSIDMINQNILPMYQLSTDQGRSALLLGSYFAGLALASARLGVVHGIAHPLGALYHVPHGLICAVCFPASLALHRPAIGEKYAILSDVVGMDFLERVQILLDALHIVSPFKGKTIFDKEKIITETLASGSTKASPRLIEKKDVEYILSSLF